MEFLSVALILKAGIQEFCERLMSSAVEAISDYENFRQNPRDSLGTSRRRQKNGCRECYACGRKDQNRTKGRLQLYNVGRTFSKRMALDILGPLP
ncbi:hypothetical protein AVEN_49463-1 [Araneus ventricosus]|uniref:Uncharacterized protein n=1 Tax=Araneus ventricosus TaxID=182803 RepID=A0A4Y2CNV1_ARAVE|nr:hypothetical protein AVEN_49463-1 [Araneus ventricosus]